MEQQNKKCFGSKLINNLFLVIVVLLQTIQHSWANVIVTAELSDGQFSRWISLDLEGLRFKETSLTLQAG